MTSIYYASIPTCGNWFHTNLLEHESDDRAGDRTVTSVCANKEERYDTSAANLINICPCIMLQQNRNYGRDRDIGSCESLVNMISKIY